jgi:hypothetical protein
MKYAFVSITILFIWIATIMIVYFLKTDSVMFPILALIMSISLFMMGFKNKK